MSLVNLAHVCSHLQNASLARLGLTSIPYTKWHLSFALLLQKQGFLSQVKLAGPSPPASCFGQGPRDDHHVTNHPHGAAGRNRHSPEAALAMMIRQGADGHELQRQGFDQEAIEFAEQHGRRSQQELEALGWRERTAHFLADAQAQLHVLVEEREREFERRLSLCEDLEQQEALRAELGSTPAERRTNALVQFLARLPSAQAELVQKYDGVLPEELFRTPFALADLEAVAGNAAYVTEREIRHHGVTIEAMGLAVSNQTITLPRPEYQDPDMMEAEGVVTRANRASRRLWLGLKYYESSPVLSKASMISKPTKRIWLNSRDLARVVRGSQAGEVKPLTHIGEIMAVSTDKGIMEARECMERRIGGMPLCRVW